MNCQKGIALAPKRVKVFLALAPRGVDLTQTAYSALDAKLLMSFDWLESLHLAPHGIDFTTVEDKIASQNSGAV